MNNFHIIVKVGYFQLWAKINFVSLIQRSRPMYMIYHNLKRLSLILSWKINWNFCVRLQVLHILFFLYCVSIRSYSAIHVYLMKHCTIRNLKSKEADAQLLKHKLPKDLYIQRFLRTFYRYIWYIICRFALSMIINFWTLFFYSASEWLSWFSLTASVYDPISMNISLGTKPTLPLSRNNVIQV